MGKTTLAKRLAESFNYQALLERADENPFLERFYQNRKQAALATQLFFLFQRAQKIQDMRQSRIYSSQCASSDFLVEKDPLFARINLEIDEFQLYEKVYQQLTIDAPHTRPGYLPSGLHRCAAFAYRQPAAYGFEQSIDPGTILRRLNEVYSEFFLYYDGAPLLIVNASEIDLVNGDGGLPDTWWITCWIFAAVATISTPPSSDSSRIQRGDAMGKVTINTLQQDEGSEGEKFVCITAYDATFARIISRGRRRNYPGGRLTGHGLCRATTAPSR